MKIIPIKLEDYKEAATVLVDAFQNDPIFKYVFETKEDYFKIAPWVFGSWIKWSIKYGEAWMTEDKKAVLIMRSLESSEMTLWSMIKSGMLPTPFRMGMRSFFKFYFGMAQLLENKNKEVMGNRKHWYGLMIGVDPKSRGIGRNLIHFATKMADDRKIPIYLETGGFHNLGMYHHFGFHTEEMVHVEKAGFDLFLMVREPQIKSMKAA